MRSDIKLRFNFWGIIKIPIPERFKRETQGVWNPKTNSFSLAFNAYHMIPSFESSVPSRIDLLPYFFFNYYYYKEDTQTRDLLEREILLSIKLYTCALSFSRCPGVSIFSFFLVYVSFNEVHVCYFRPVSQPIYYYGATCWNFLYLHYITKRVFSSSHLQVSNP